MTDRHLLLEKLEVTNCCLAERREFARLFGEGNVCTHERVMQGAQIFDWFDANRRLLTPAQQKIFRTYVTLGFKMAARVPDKEQSLRRSVLADAFYKAYNSPEE